MGNPRCHVVILTYPAQGHINPLLQFAKRLHSKGVKATLATTPYTLKSINSPSVDLEPISDGFDESGYNQSSGVEAYLASFKKAGSTTLTDLILKFNASDFPVTCIVYDSLLTWAVDVAKDLGIYAAVFLTNSASVCSIYWKIAKGLLTLPVNQESFPLSLPGLPPLDCCDLPSFLAAPSAHAAYLAAIMDQFHSLEGIDWVFCNSFVELENELIKAMKGLWAVEMVGPMVPSAYLDQHIRDDTAYGASLWEAAGDECKKWLNTKPPRSVIYVSFGSMADISAKQVEEIAWGLKASNMAFLWVMKTKWKNKLPVNFEDPESQKGLIVEWCNQLEVLAHNSIACFVTHSGWNSTLEGLSLGVPMICITQWSDQPTNAKFVETIWKVGVRADKDENGIVSRDQVCNCINEVMVGDCSQEIWKNASDWSLLAKTAASEGGSSDTTINQFVMKLLELKGTEP